MSFILKPGDKCFKTDGTEVYYCCDRVFEGNIYHVVCDRPKYMFVNDLEFISHCTLESQIFKKKPVNKKDDIIKAKAEIDFLKGQILLLEEKRDDLLSHINYFIKDDLINLLDGNINYIVKFKPFKEKYDRFEMDIFKTGDPGVNFVSVDAEYGGHELAFVTLWLDNNSHKWSLVSPHNSFASNGEKGTNAKFKENDQILRFFTTWSRTKDWIYNYLEKEYIGKHLSKYETERVVDFLKKYDIDIPSNIKIDYFNKINKDIEKRSIRVDLQQTY